jgi:hypothetical protein
LNTRMYTVFLLQLHVQFNRETDSSYTF